MKKLRLRNLKKRLQDATTSKCPRRSPLIVLMVLLVINIFAYYKLANAESYYTIWSGFYPLDREQNESKDEHYSKNGG